MPKTDTKPHRMNIYVTPITRRRMQAVAKKLYDSGVFGVVDEEGNVIPSALFRYFIEREMRTLKITEDEIQLEETKNE